MNLFKFAAKRSYYHSEQHVHHCLVDLATVDRLDVFLVDFTVTSAIYVTMVKDLSRDCRYLRQKKNWCHWIFFHYAGFFIECAVEKATTGVEVSDARGDTHNELQSKVPQKYRPITSYWFFKTFVEPITEIGLFLKGEVVVGFLKR